MGKSIGYGAGYQYPHDFEGHYVREEYLPEELAGPASTPPSDSGYEREISAVRQARLRRPRDDQTNNDKK